MHDLARHPNFAAEGPMLERLAGAIGCSQEFLEISEGGCCRLSVRISWNGEGEKNKRPFSSSGDASSEALGPYSHHNSGLSEPAAVAKEVRAAPPCRSSDNRLDDPSLFHGASRDHIPDILYKTDCDQRPRSRFSTPHATELSGSETRFCSN